MPRYNKEEDKGYAPREYTHPEALHFVVVDDAQVGEDRERGEDALQPHICQVICVE